MGDNNFDSQEKDINIEYLNNKLEKMDTLIAD